MITKINIYLALIVCSLCFFSCADEEKSIESNQDVSSVVVLNTENADDVEEGEKTDKPIDYAKLNLSSIIIQAKVIDEVGSHFEDLRVIEGQEVRQYFGANDDIEMKIILENGVTIDPDVLLDCIGSVDYNPVTFFSQAKFYKECVVSKTGVETKFQPTKTSVRGSEKMRYGYRFY